MSRAEDTRERLRAALAVCQSLLEDEGLTNTLGDVVERIVVSIRSGGKVLLCGNGGSAADATHLAAELMGRFCLEREPFPAVALADNMAAITAVANDYGYEEVFARAVRGLGRPGDVLIALSTSGRSHNVVAALTAARDRQMATVAFVGADVDSPIGCAADHVLAVGGPDTARIQEGHMLLGHIVFELVERELCA